MSNNNSSNFGTYAGIAVALGGLAAIGTVLYNEYQEQQNRNNNYSYGGRGSRQQEEEERRRNLRILNEERERLQAIMEEERLRKIQEEREKKRIQAQETIEQKMESRKKREKEQEEKNRKEEEILRLKTNELNKIDEEFNKFFGTSGDANSSDENDCFLDAIDPNRRIKKEFRKTRQQENKQRDLERQIDEELRSELNRKAKLLDVSDQKKAHQSPSEWNKSLNNLDDASGALDYPSSTSNNVDAKKEENDVDKTPVVAKQEHNKNNCTKSKKKKKKSKKKQNKVDISKNDQTKTTKRENITKPSSTSKGPQVNVVTKPKQNVSAKVK